MKKGAQGQLGLLFYRVPSRTAVRYLAQLHNDICRGFQVLSRKARCIHRARNEGDNPFLGTMYK